MLSPSPISLLCALLLCLPLAIIFTITTPSSPSSVPPTTTTTTPHASSAAVYGGVSPILSTTAIISAVTPPPYRNRTIETYPEPEPVTTLKLPTVKTPEKPTKNLTTPIATSPSPVIRRLKLPSAVVSREEADYAEDELLFQRAARVNSASKRVNSPKKVAFMFLTTTPLPFAPLWERFFKNAPKNLYNVYVHADPRFNYTPPFRGVFARRVIASKPTRRHSPTLIAAARRLLARALLDDGSNYMFALLSASCIPLHSFDFTYKTLIRSRKSFIEILGNESWAYDRWAARGEDAMLPEVKFEDFRIGSQFFSLTRKHAKIVVRDRRLWSKFKLPCVRGRSTCYPEENYFPTLLNMVDPRRCVHATLTHVDWKGSHGGHPRTYDGFEVGPELISALRRIRPRYGDEEMNGSYSPVVTKRHDPFLFARKFSPDCLQPLMNISSDVIFRD